MKSFSDCLSRVIVAAESAWRRMRWLLFTTFTWETWLVLGLSAFLANPGQSSGGLNFLSSGRRFFGGSEAETTQQMQQLAIHAMEWIRMHLPLVLIVGGLIVVLLVVVGLILLWLSSRAQFTLLAGVARARVEFMNPWKEFREAGFSLFLWRLAFGLIAGAVWLLLIGSGVALFLLVFRQGMGLIIALAVGMVLLVLGLLLLNLCIIRCLEDFVVPLMYHYRLGAMAAWRYFGEIFRVHSRMILAYLLAWIVLKVLAVFAVIAAVLVTCCIAGCLLVIPYVGAVALLPVTVFFRCFSLYVLESLHPDYKIIQEPVTAPNPAAGPAPQSNLNP